MRTKILDAGREHFVEFGYAEANVDAIAVAAGVSKGSIYRHFPSKGALYFAVLSANSHEFFEGLRAHVRRRRTCRPPSGFRKLWGNYLKHWLRNPTDFEIFWAFDNAEELGELPEGLTDRIAENWTRALRLTEQVLDDGVERGELIQVDTWKAAHFWTLATTLIDHDNNRASPHAGSALSRDLRVRHRAPASRTSGGSGRGEPLRFSRRARTDRRHAPAIGMCGGWPSARSRRAGRIRGRGPHRVIMTHPSSIRDHGGLFMPTAERRRQQRRRRRRWRRPYALEPIQNADAAT